MFTQCPECATVFRVTADALRVARGTVRCGICSASFNALEFLSEQPVPRHGDDPVQEDTITVEELPGTEFIELSGSIEAAPDSPAGRPDPSDDEAAEPLDAAVAGDLVGTGESNTDDVGDAELEFRGSAEDLERLFVTADPQSMWHPPARSGHEDGQAEDDREELDRAITAIADGEFSGIEVVEEEFPGFDDEDGAGDSSPGRIAAVLAFRGAGETGPEATTETETGSGTTEQEPEEADSGDGSTLDRTDEYPILVLDDPSTETEAVTEPADESHYPAETAGAADETLRLLIPEELRYQPALSASSAFESEPEHGSPRWPLAVVAAILITVLAAQAIHFWREDLVRNPATGPWLIRIYAALGTKLSVPADLSAFELRQLGAASDGVQAGRIKVRASIVNRAAFAQPLPLLRLSLQDRFGSTIGTRDLEPEEYLPGGTASASGLLGPSQRADAEVVFVDPGRDAVGFELDVCLRGIGGIHCSSAADDQP